VQLVALQIRLGCANSALAWTPQLEDYAWRGHDGLSRGDLLQSSQTGEVRLLRECRHAFAYDAYGGRH